MINFFFLEFCFLQDLSLMRCGLTFSLAPFGGPRPLYSLRDEFVLETTRFTLPEGKSVQELYAECLK